MRAFFHGWRRKVGCVTLVMACAVAGMWMRSYSVFNRVHVMRPTSVHLFDSVWGSICWTRQDYVPRSMYGFDFESINLSDFASLDKPVQPGEIRDPHFIKDAAWFWQWGGFSFGAAAPDIMTFEQWIMPYWALVLPMTLLSGHLIFWKPRKRTLNATTVIQSPQE